MLGKGQKDTNLHIYCVSSVCLTPGHQVSHTVAHRMKIALFPSPKTFWFNKYSLSSYYVPSPWSGCQENKNEWNSRGPQPSRGDRWVYNSNNVLIVVRKIQPGHTGDLTLPGDVEENFKTAVIELGFDGWIEVCQVDQAGKGFQREGIVSAKAQREECQGPINISQESNGKWEPIREGLLGTPWSLAFPCEVMEI